MTPTDAEVPKNEILEAIESIKVSLEGLPDYDPRFRQLYKSSFLLSQHFLDFGEPLVDWLDDFVIDNVWAMPKCQTQVIVGCLHEATPKGRRKLNISRSSSMGNPFILKKDGGNFETAEDATNAYIPWLQLQLRDTSSKEYAWFEKQSERLCSGERLILGCCGDKYCHGIYIAHLLHTGDWRRWEIIDVEDWCARAIELLVKNWGRFDDFACNSAHIPLGAPDFDERAANATKPGKLYGEGLALTSEMQFLDWDDPGPGVKELYAFVALILLVHIEDNNHCLIKGKTSKQFLKAVRIIKDCQGFPKTEEEKQQEEVDWLVSNGSSTAEILRSAASKGISNTYNLERYADAARQEQESADEILDAIDRLMDAGVVPEIHLEDYFPAKWLPCFRVLKEGLKFQDDVIVSTIVCVVGAMLPPTSRIHGFSMAEKIILWLFFIGTSGTAKSVLLKVLMMHPLQFGVLPSVKDLNQRIQKDYAKAVADYNKAKAKLSKKDAEQDTELPKKPESSRKQTVLYTAPTTQGIRSDMAETGTFLPSLLAKDELSSWFKEMGSPQRQTDTEFYLSAYDGAYSNERFADESKSREVEEGALSIIGGIQPKVYFGFLADGNDNGFNARPLFFQVPRLEREPLHKSEDDLNLDIYLGDLYEAAFRLGPIAPQLQTLREREDFEPLQPPELSRRPTFWLGKAAEKLFYEAFKELERKSMIAGSDEVEALWAKAPGQLLRWAAPIQFIRNHTGMESHSDDEWFPPPEILSNNDFEDIASAHESDGEAIELHIRTLYPKISADTIKLALNLVIAGKTQGVDLVERATDPKAQQLRVFLDYVEKHTPKSPIAGVKLSKIAKNAWNSKNRPKRAELNQLAQLAKSRALVVFVEKGSAVRFVR